MRISKWVLGAFLILVINSAYLWPLDDPTLFYVSNVILHLLLGIGLTGAAVFYFPGIFRAKSTLPKIAVVVFLTSSLAGFGLMIFGNFHSTRWLLYTHISIALAAFLCFMLSILSLRKEPDASPRLLRLWRATLTALLVLLLFPPGVIGYRRIFPSRWDRIRNPGTAPLSMDGEGDGPQSPFFPSSATTTTGKVIPSNFFMTSETCKTCHADIYKQWNSSMHHFSSFNNQWYRKSIEYMQDVVGTKPSKWCAGCHDHAVFFNGKFDTPVKQIIHTPEAQAGLACTSCHSIVQVKSSMGNGAFVIEYPPLHDLATSQNWFLRTAHDFLTRVNPAPHKKVFMKPFHRQDAPEMCSSCHKVHLDIPVNGYRWFRGFNDYDNWQASGVSGQGGRSFYYPKEPMRCTTCHMPLVPSSDLGNVAGMIHSHRFAAANTAVPAANGDQEQLDAVTQFLKNNHVSVDIFALSTAPPTESASLTLTGARREGPQLSSTFAQGEESEMYGAPGFLAESSTEVIAPIDRVNMEVRRGDSVRVDAVVRTRTVGHFFPGGTVDAFDVWLELQAIDENGKTIFWSGRVEQEGKGAVESGAHMYRSYMLDGHGNLINKRNAWSARSVLYVRLIPPGAADTVHFRMQIPQDCGNRITLKARLNYRKFNWWNTQWAFAGIRNPLQPVFALSKDFDDGEWSFAGSLSDVSSRTPRIPDVPIVTMAENTRELRILDSKAPKPDLQSRFDKTDLLRWNDYGIGLLLQGDLRAAETAFLQVTRIDPQYADGWVNVARVRVQEGNIAGAREVLDKALALNPTLAKAHFFYAMALKSLGKYDESLRHLQTAITQYPRDRVFRNQAGRLLFLKRQYQPAISQFQEALGIDPEDLQAHYNLMLCYQGLGNQEMADREKTLYLRFKADESAQEITGPVRLQHPEANNERQPIHEHRSVPLAQAALKPGKSY
jgi:tetratricopeptide (TPR) repeat protein